MLSLLVGELRVEDPCSFRNYLRMSDALFDELCGLVAPAIKRNDTNMRLAISVISTDRGLLYFILLLHYCMVIYFQITML